MATPGPALPRGSTTTSRSRRQSGTTPIAPVIGGTLALALFVGLEWSTLALVFGIGFLLHVAMDQLFFLFAVKRRAALAPSLEGEPAC